MGRGRAKAKQVKVARRLKYNSGGTDLDRLREDLGINQDSEEESEEDFYAELAAKYADYEDNEDS